MFAFYCNVLYVDGENLFVVSHQQLAFLGCRTPSWRGAAVPQPGISSVPGGLSTMNLNGGILLHRGKGRAERRILQLLLG